MDLLAMILIKVADISNEARPMDVAEPWLDRLLQEFFKQSDAEKLEGLPVTPFMDREKITKPSSQCSFIGLVLLPLFEALGALLTELHEVIVQPVRDALDYYRRLNDATKEKRLHRKSVVAELLAHPALARSSVGCPSQNHNFIYRNLDSSDPQNAVPNASLQSRKGLLLRSRSRSTEDRLETVIAVETDEEPNLADLIEDDESDGSETATEVEVCEKAFKFKISTDSSISNAGSRKSSRDRTQIAKDLEKRRGKFTSTLSFDGATLKRSPMEMQESAEILRKFKGRSFDRGRCGDTQSPVSDQSLDFLAEIEIARKCDAEATHPDDIASEEVLFDEIIVDEASPQVKASPSSNPRSFLSRLRQFTDRFYLSECKNAKLSPILPGKQLHEEHAKASTLPKAMKRSADKATRCVGEMGEEFAANSLGNITSKKLDGHSVPGSSQSGTTAASTENFLVQSEGQSCPQEQTPAVDL